MAFRGGGPPPTATVYVANLPPGTDEELLAEHFGTIGIIKTDKRTNRPKIWIYRDRDTGEPKGDATVTYEDPFAAPAAVDWFNGKEFHGTPISVSLAENKGSTRGAGVSNGPPDISARAAQAPPEQEEPAAEEQGYAGGEGRGGAGMGRGGPLGGPGEGAGLGGGGGRGGMGRGGGRGGGRSGQDGDWPCPNPSCGNVNFAFRGECNRCNTPRPGGAGRGGRGGGRGGAAGGASGGGLFGPSDWPCPMCGNMNWAKRNKCNICNTSKPGGPSLGAREGKGGGFKELDEAELEEVRRRRREAEEEDDGEMYDEFGNLKKKFRKKTVEGTPQAGAGAAKGGKALWEEDLKGITKQGSKSQKGEPQYHRPAEGAERGEERGGSWRGGNDNGRGHERSELGRRGADRDEDTDLRKARDGSWDRRREEEPSRDRARDEGRRRGDEYEARGRGSREKDWDRSRDGERDRSRDGDTGRGRRSEDDDYRLRR